VWQVGKNGKVPLPIHELLACSPLMPATPFNFPLRPPRRDLADHFAVEVQVGATVGGHDGGFGDAQAGEAMNPEFRLDHVGGSASMTGPSSSGSVKSVH